jgi:hypothetical protein
MTTPDGRRPAAGAEPTLRIGTNRSVTAPPGMTCVVTSIRRWSACTFRARPIGFRGAHGQFERGQRALQGLQAPDTLGRTRSNRSANSGRRRTPPLAHPRRWICARPPRRRPPRPVAAAVGRPVEARRSGDQDGGACPSGQARRRDPSRSGGNEPPARARRARAWRRRPRPRHPRWTQITRAAEPGVENRRRPRPARPRRRNAASLLTKAHGIRSPRATAPVSATMPARPARVTRQDTGAPVDPSSAADTRVWVRHRVLQAKLSTRGPQP